MGPSRSSAAIAVLTAPASVTSNGATSVAASSRESSAAAASSLVRLRPLRMTVAPARASPHAMAKPSPEPPPVTSARRPDRSKGWVEPRGSSEGLTQAEHVLHVENAGRSVAASGGNEARRSQRAVREVRA